MLLNLIIFNAEGVVCDTNLNRWCKLLQRSFQRGQAPQLYGLHSQWCSTTGSKEYFRKEKKTKKKHENYGQLY
jgi:hypothetical protein